MDTANMKSFLASPTTPSTPPIYVIPTDDSPLIPSYILIASVLLPPLIYAIHKDYSTFLSLGPGGTRYDFLGYLQITFLRLFALSNPCSPGPVPAPLRNTGFINAARLPNRLSERPTITGIAPHRQTSQRAQKAVFEGFKRRVERLAEETEGLCMGVSSFEKHGPALFSESVVNETKGGEVVHLHTLDGSMHMTLHPEDVKTVLEKGWGERHPLARGGWCCRFVPSGFTMIYAPRTEKEVETVLNIIKAGVSWVRGERVFE